MEVDEPVVKLKTSDGKRFTLTKSEASCFNALHMMIESFQNSPNASNEYINLQSVHSEFLSMVIEWCRAHCTDQPDSFDGRTDATCDSETELTKWDVDFFNSMSEDRLFRLMHVANYLDVRKLFNACCRTVGKRWESMKVDELRRLYRIEPNFSAEEEREMIQESKKLGFNE